MEGQITEADWFRGPPEEIKRSTHTGWDLPDNYVGIDLYKWDYLARFFQGALERKDAEAIQNTLDVEIDGCTFGDFVNMNFVMAHLKQGGVDE